MRKMEQWWVQCSEPTEAHVARDQDIALTLLTPNNGYPRNTGNNVASVLPFRCASRPCNVGIEHLHAEHSPAQQTPHMCRLNVQAPRVSRSSDQKESHSTFEIRRGSATQQKNFEENLPRVDSAPF